ncbi:pilus assembly protein PilM [uncultured Gimesia sp.]|uniref:pilus assembly protein PilM n=1 Tax=uncultured Gimesia sp. TaxID=1678688 RepID=UPI0030DD925F|tara:strand:+ start:129610 stop:130683 length:1074 start_codon:yes stop_codon:yes gene_type:complete
MISIQRSQYSPIGLQLGPSSATLVQLTGPRHNRVVHAIAQEHFDIDEKCSLEERDAKIALELRRILSDHHFKGRRVISCLGSQELFIQNVRLPQLPAEEIPKVVAWEAEERLPYPVADAEIRHLPAGQVRQESNTKQEVILLACHNGILERHLNLLEQAGLTAVAIDVEPSATLRCFHDASENTHTNSASCYLNFGDAATTVIFADQQNVLFLKYIMQGSDHLDRAVADNLDMPLKEAIRLRKIVTNSPTLDASDELHRSVIDSIRSILESISTEVENCLRYYKVTFRGKKLDQLIVTGNESSPWLIDFLSERLNTDCKMGNPFESLKRWPTSTSLLERPGRWTTAMGLAMKEKVDR